MRTYVVRVQDTRAADQRDALRGMADEVATGRRITFTSAAELLGILSAAEGDDGGPQRTERDQGGRSERTSARAARPAHPID